MSGSALVHPRYSEACLADVLPGVLAALGVPGADPLGLAEGPLAGVRRVAVLLVDGLGWHQLPLAARYAPTLAELAAGRLGSARAITSGFPSTTPTSLVTLGTGAAPGAHGVLGFTLRVPETGRVLNHIEWWDDPPPSRWQPIPTQFQRAVAAGVAATVVSRARFAGSGLTVAAYRGAAYRGTDTLDETHTAMLDALAGGPAPALVYGYHADLDMIGHRYGVDSQRWRDAAAEVDRLVSALVAGLPPDGALVVTADHGQLDVPAEARYDCDRDPRLLAGVDTVAGEPRVRYLHTPAGAAADVVAAWRGVLGAHASVLFRDEAVAAGWFGPVPAEHLARIGDVVVLCHDRYAVLAGRHEPKTVSELVAFHGSASAVEMEVPLLVAGSVTGTR